MPGCSKMGALTTKQSAFALLYATRTDLTIEQCAKMAGSKSTTPGVIGCQWLAKPEVQAEIQRHRDTQATNINLTKEWWLQRHMEIANLDPSDLYDDSGFPKPLSEIPVEARKCIKRIKAVEMFGGEGDQRSVVGIVRDIEMLDPQKALETIGKHMGWSVERVEHTGSVTVVTGVPDE